MAGRGYHFLALCILFGTFIVLQAKDNEILKRAKRTTPTVYNVYALDHFIELVEKIERNVTRFSDVATYIRQLGYDNDYWSTVVGTALPLPSGILTNQEKDVLRKMIAHRYDWSRELGVVLTPSGKTIAIGHVINGICAGLVRDKQISLIKWSPGAEREVDTLYAATISRDLAQAILKKKNNPSLPYFGPSGSWDDTKCPERYSRSSSVSTGASDAELLGDMDGFLLGYHLAPWERKGVRLGQLFRMYYSTGVCYDMSIASCKRYSKFKSLVNNEGLYEKIFAVVEAFYLKDSSSYPNVKKEDLPAATKSTIEKFFPYLDNLQNNQKCPQKVEGCDLPANVVFVMDESGSISHDHFKVEKDFVRDIIDALEVSPRQTKVAIVEFSSYANIDIRLRDYGSKTRLKCAVNKIRQMGGMTHTANALQLVKDNILWPLQREQLANAESKQDVSNIVILLTDGKSNDPDTTALERVVKEIMKEIRDLTMTSVGVGNYNYDELKLIATDPYKHVFTANDFTALLYLVKTLQRRTCTTPVQMELDFTVTGNNTVITAYVQPGSVRFFALAPLYFYGVKDIDIAIKPLYGSLKIYASRITDTPGPGNYTHKVDSIPIGQELSLHISNPCSGYNKTTCPPIYLAIYADQVNCACTEPQCSVPGQIKFTIQRGRGGVQHVQASLLFVLIGLALYYVL